MNLPRALIVEDNPQFRNLLCSTLQQDSGCEVVGYATDGLDAIQKAQDLHPDLILLDLGLPKLNGMEVMRRLHKSSPKLKILVVSQDCSPEIVQAALRLGALGYLLKSDATDLPMAVEAIMQDKTFVSALPS